MQKKDLRKAVVLFMSGCYCISMYIYIYLCMWKKKEYRFKDQNGTID